MERVRQAEPGDLDRCADLLGAAISEAEGRRGGPLLVARGADAGAERPLAPTVPAALATWASDEAHRLVVGLIDEVAVGVAAGALTGPPSGPLGLVECCYVEPGARAVGVGSALVADLLGWFRERGCRGMDAWALPGDRATKQLFEASGLSARLLVLHRQLP